MLLKANSGRGHIDSDPSLSRFLQRWPLLPGRRTSIAVVGMLLGICVCAVSQNLKVTAEDANLERVIVLDGRTNAISYYVQITSDVAVPRLVLIPVISSPVVNGLTAAISVLPKIPLYHRRFQLTFSSPCRDSLSPAFMKVRSLCEQPTNQSRKG
jgi:hypothetical protein